jgi:hypothetical protein
VGDHPLRERFSCLGRRLEVFVLRKRMILTACQLFFDRVRTGYTSIVTNRTSHHTCMLLEKWYERFGA